MSRLQINKCIHCKFKNGIIEGLFAENEKLKYDLKYSYKDNEDEKVLVDLLKAENEE